MKDTADASGGPVRARAEWLPPLLAVFALQTVTAFMTMFLVTIGPALIAETGWGESSVGYFATLTIWGSIAFLLTGSPLLRRAGPIRTLQIGLAVAAVGIVLLTVPVWATVLAASFMFGLAYGPTAPVGSDVVHRIAPARHRSVMFSVKQAGVPLGGVLAGLILPPVVQFAGWRATLVVALVLIALCAAIVQPLRGRLDAVRRPDQPLSLRVMLSGGNLVEPLVTLWRPPETFRLALAASCMSAAQGAWFAFLVTYLVTQLDIALATAGALFALMQGTAIGGRVLLGWTADRLQSAILTLSLVAICSTLATVGLALTDGDWPLWWLAMLSVAAGFSVASWNGVLLAELARVSPQGAVGEVAAGAAIVIFVGYSSGPSTVATILALSGRFDLALVPVAFATLGALALFLSLARRRARQARAAVAEG